MNEYKTIIPAAIKRPTVFLRLTITQRMISGFNEKLFPLWQSNMDIQFINNSTSEITENNLEPGADYGGVVVHPPSMQISKLKTESAFLLK